MRINRNRPQKLFGTSTSQNGCLATFLFLGILLGTGILVWDWLSDWLHIQETDGAFLREQMTDALQDGDLDLVIANAQILLEQMPDDWDALAMLVRGLIYRSYNDYALSGDRLIAQQYVERAYQQYPSSLEAIALYAYVSQVNGNSEDAARLALIVIDQNPDSIPARLALSLAYGGQGIFEAALRDAVKAVELASQARQEDWLVDALRVLAIAYHDVGRYEDAIVTIDRALTFNRKLLPLHFERGLYALQQGDNDMATASYFNVIAFDATNAKAYLRLCELSSKLRETALAERYCQQASDFAPTWDAVWSQLGYEYFLQGRYRDAQASFERCSRLQIAQDVPILERDMDCWMLQGQSAEIMGDCQGLLTVYQQFQTMQQTADLPQNWVYPPEGPNICTTPIAPS